MISRTGGTLFGIVAVAGMFWLASPAAAQDLAPLQDRLDRLERALNDLKIVVHRGKPAGGSSGSTTVIENDDLPAAGVNGKIAALEAENAKLKKLLAEQLLAIEGLKEIAGKKW